jgi:L-alanine-DL-glutamate epimerase-like enolase superfamily enzyme
VSIKDDGRGGFALCACLEGHVVRGDAPFFPGRTTPCTAQEVSLAWHTVASAIGDAVSAEELAGRLQGCAAPAAFAAWQAAVAWRAWRAGRSVTSLLAHEADRAPSSTVCTAGLIQDGGRAGLPAMATLKWKTPPADVAALAWCRRIRPDATLRLDGNRALSMNEVIALAEVCGPALQFVEEPCAPAELAQIGTRVPLALDESLAESDIDIDVVLGLGARAIVLKPAALGPARTLSLARAACGVGLPVVFSGVGEGRAGLCSLVALHAVWGTGDAGLGTFAWREDTLDLFDPVGHFQGPLP